MTYHKFCGILSLTREKINLLEEELMLNDEIRKKREELNKSIEENKNYDYIYRISVELDELIAKYYREVQSPLSQIRLN